MDYGFKREQEEWEFTDGVIHLLREISSTKRQDIVIKCLPKLADVAYISHFKYSTNMRENLFKSLASIVKNIGKKPFRQQIETFIDPAFKNGNGNFILSALAAQDFVVFLS